MDQTGSRPPNSDHDPFLLRVWLWEVFWSFFSVQPQSSSLLVVIHNPHFNAHHNPIEKFLLLGRIRDDDNSEHWFFFDLWSAYEAPTYRAFSPFQFASNAEWPTIVWSMLSSSATSHVAVRESISMIFSIGHCQFTMVSNYTPHLQGSCLLCRTPLTTTAMCVH